MELLEGNPGVSVGYMDEKPGPYVLFESDVTLLVCRPNSAGIGRDPPHPSKSQIS